MSSSPISRTHSCPLPTIIENPRCSECLGEDSPTTQPDITNIKCNYIFMAIHGKRLEFCSKECFTDYFYRIVEEKIEGKKK